MIGHRHTAGSCTDRASSRAGDGHETRQIATSVTGRDSSPVERAPDIAEIFRRYFVSKLKASGLSGVKFGEAIGMSTSSVHMKANGVRGVDGDDLEKLTRTPGHEMSRTDLLADLARFAFGEMLPPPATPPPEVVPVPGGSARKGVARFLSTPSTASEGRRAPSRQDDSTDGKAAPPQTRRRDPR